MKQATLALAFLILLANALCFAEESSTAQDDEQFMLDLLASNFEETPYTALVKIVEVERKGNEMLYPTYLYKCEVIETYKGKKLERVVFLRGIEEEPKTFPIGKTYIVSLFVNKKDGRFFLGDNGWDLPATENLIESARKLSQEAGKSKSPNPLPD